MANGNVGRVVVVGNGMVGHRFVDLLAARGLTSRFQVTIFGEEPRAAYDRVNLSGFFDGKTADDLAMGNADQYRAAGFEVVFGDRIVAIDRPSKTVVAASGRKVPYDTLILATGSYPFIPP